MFARTCGEVQARPNFVGPTSELAIFQFCREIREKELSDDAIVMRVLKVVQSHVEVLERISNIVFNEPLARTIILAVDYSELKSTKPFENAARKLLCLIMKVYVESVAKTQVIRVKNKTLFVLRMEQYGVSIGFRAETDSRSLFPDGNVLTVMVDMIAIVALIVFSRND